MSQKFVAKTDGTLFCEYCGCDAPSQVQCRFVPVGPNYTRWVCFAGALFALMVGVFFKTSGERAFRIIHKDVVLDEAHAPFTFESAWNAFGSEHFQWLESGVYLFWKHHPLALRHLEHNLTVVRVQKSGLCFMHAPATLQHYLLTLYSGNSSAMLDVASFLRYNASWQDLWDHVWSNHGGSSVKFLEDLVNITGKDMVDFPLRVTARHFPTTWTTLITDSMKTYGPALVSRFHVTPDFVDQNANDSFLSNSSVDFSTSRGLHAMLLIGFRNVGTSTVFLLQNWWTHMPLVEVSQEYLLAHDPTITFVTANISAITNFYPKVYGQYFETEADVGEGEDLECCL